MESYFFSKRNYQTIYNIFQKNLKKIMDKDISETPEYKKKIIESMKYIYSKKKALNIPDSLSEQEKSVYLSKHLIRILIQREQDLVKKQTIPKPNSLSTPITTLKSDYTEDINKKLEENQKKRLQTNNGNINEFFKGNQEINNGIKAQLEDNVDIQAKYAELTKNRQYQYENLNDGMRRPEMFQPIVEGNPLKIIDENEKEPDMQEDNVNMDNLLADFQTLTETIPKEPNRPSFIAPVQDKSNSLLADTSLEAVGIKEDTRIKYDEEAEKKKKRARKPKSRILVINSGDRDLSHLPENFNKYNFRVSFNNKNKDPPFPNIPTAIKNVVEISLKRVCIPRPYFYTAFPFLFIKISELNSNIISTHRSGKEIFSKIVFDKLFDSLIEYEDSSGRRIRHREFMYYINPDAESIKFIKPLPSIDSLNIELLSPTFRNVQDYWVDSDVGWTDSSGIVGGISKLTGVSREAKAGTRYNDIVFTSSKQIITDRFLANTYPTDIIKNAKTGREYKVISFTQQTGTVDNATIEGEPAEPPTLTIGDVGDFRQNSSIYVDNEVQYVNMSNQIQYIFEIKTV